MRAMLLRSALEPPDGISGMVQEHRVSGNSALLQPSFPHAFGGNPEGGAGLDSRQKHAGMTMPVLLDFEPCRKSHAEARKKLLALLCVSASLRKVIRLLSFIFWLWPAGRFPWLE